MNRLHISFEPSTALELGLLFVVHAAIATIFLVVGLSRSFDQLTILAIWSPMPLSVLILTITRLLALTGRRAMRLGFSEKLARIVFQLTGIVLMVLYFG